MQNGIWRSIRWFYLGLCFPNLFHHIIPTGWLILADWIQTRDSPPIACDHEWLALFQLVQDTFCFLMQLFGRHGSHMKAG